MNTTTLINGGFEQKTRIDTWGNKIPQWSLLRGEYRFEVEITRIGPRLSCINRFGEPFKTYKNTFVQGQDWQEQILEIVKNLS